MPQSTVTRLGEKGRKGSLFFGASRRFYFKRPFGRRELPMAEQSSTVATFRALVMLICLILIPVAAFCGSSFPAVLKAVQSGHWPSLADFRGPSGPPTQSTEAPRFSPPQMGLSSATATNANGISGGLGPMHQSEATRSQVIAANYNAPVAATPSLGGAGLPTSFPQNRDPIAGANRGLSPIPPGTDSLLPLDPQGHGRPAVVPGTPSGLAADSPADQFKHVQERLRQLGATYYLLETCGDQKSEFRFFCRMSIGGNPRVTVPFWCIDGDPVKAMTQVLKQVEDWQSGGR